MALPTQTDTSMDSGDKLVGSDDGQVPYQLSSRASDRINQATRRFGIAATEVILPAEPTPSAVGRIQGLLPKIVEAILGDSNIAILEKPAWPSFLSAAAGCADEGSLGGMTMILGLGGSTSLPGQRLVSTIEPILLAHGKLQALGLPAPSLVIFKATALAHLVNGLDWTRAAAVTDCTLDFIRKYIGRFHPASLPGAELVSDDLSGMRRLLDEVITPLATRIPPTAAMLRLARNRCSPLDAMKYGVAHAYQLQALVPVRGAGSPFSVFGPGYTAPYPRFVLAYGGIAERLFLDVIRAAVTQASPDAFRAVPKMHVISRLGRKPAYAPFEGEPQIGDGLSERALEALAGKSTGDGRTRDDWAAIDAYHAGRRRADLLDFLNEGGSRWTLK